MKKTLLQAALAVGVLLAIFGIQAYFAARTPLAEAGSIGQNVASFKELTERFTKLANDKGAVYAFDVLRAAKLPPDTDIHLLGHTIGDILYKQKGAAGIADCTQEFRNACSHTIVIGMLDEYGEAGALPLIHNACLKAPGGSGAYTMCYHGLGHGVFAYFGYDLQKTVAFCKKTGTKAYGEQEYTQCVGGVIMELAGGGGHDHELWVAAQQKYLTSDPLSPCLSTLIPEEAKTMCIMYITPRLLTLAGANLARPDPATLPKAFSFCDPLPMGSALRDSCYGSFGKEFIPLVGSRDIRAVDSFTDDQFKTAISWCMLAGPGDGKVSCVKSEVESLFWGGENNPDISFHFCTLTTGALEDACYSALATQISQYVSGVRHTELCQRLPHQYMPQCAVKKNHE